MSDQNQEADRTASDTNPSTGEQPVNPVAEQPVNPVAEQPVNATGEQPVNATGGQLVNPVAEQPASSMAGSTDTKQRAPRTDADHEDANNEDSSDDSFDGHRKRRGRRGHRARGGPSMSGQHRSRARRGAVVGAILGALEDGPNHGYGIMDKLEGLSEGRWRPSPGSVYPALGRLEHKGLIAEVPDSDPKEFEITDEGRNWLKEKGAALTRDGSPFPSGESHGLRGAVSQLAGAAKQVGRYGSEAQRQAAIELVEATTRKLYASMAEAPAEETETDE